MAAPAWPEKSRELHNHHFDSTMWSDLVFRDDDIVIVPYAKSATTWLQQIVAQLLFGEIRRWPWRRCRRGSTCGCRPAFQRPAAG